MLNRQNCAQAHHYFSIIYPTLTHYKLRHNLTLKHLNLTTIVKFTQVNSLVAIKISYYTRLFPTTIIRSLMKANELKRGMFIQHDGQNVVIRTIFVQTASSRSGNTLYKVKGQVLVSKQKFEQNFKGDENVDIIDVTRRIVQPLYREGNGWVFMDAESYEQYTLADEQLQDELAFITVRYGRGQCTCS